MRCIDFVFIAVCTFAWCVNRRSCVAGDVTLHAEVENESRRLASNKIRKKSPAPTPSKSLVKSKTSEFPTESDTVNKDYWRDPVCSKNMIVGGDGWCIPRSTWHQIAKFKASLPAAIDAELYQGSCCNRLQVFRLYLTSYFVMSRNQQFSLSRRA